MSQRVAHASVHAAVSKSLCVLSAKLSVDSACPSSKLARTIELVNKQHRIAQQVDRRTRNQREDVSGRRLTDEEKAMAAHHTFTLVLMDGMRLVSIYVENNKQLQRVRQVPATPTPPHQVEEGSTMTIDSQLTTLSWTPTTTGDIGWWRSWLFYSSPVVQVSFESVTSIERSDEWPHALTKPAAPEVSPVHGVWVDTPSLRLWLQCHDEAEQVQVVTSFQRYVQSAKKRTADNNSTRHE